MIPFFSAARNKIEQTWNEDVARSRLLQIMWFKITLLSRIHTLSHLVIVFTVGTGVAPVIGVLIVRVMSPYIVVIVK